MKVADAEGRNRGMPNENVIIRTVLFMRAWWICDGSEMSGGARKYM
jgi:hypothetical protein